MKQRKQKRIVDKDTLMNQLAKLIFRELDSGHSKAKSFAIIRKRWIHVEQQMETQLHEIVTIKSLEDVGKTGAAYVFTRNTFFKDEQ